jgi:hypothetical protein
LKRFFLVFSKGLSETYSELLKDFCQQKTDNKIKSRLICPASKESINFTKLYYPKEIVEILFINPLEFWFEHEISIYENKVAVISLNKNEVLGMIFESSEYAKSQTAIFNLAWLGASSFIAI